jgi:hypothetical protein
MRKLVFRTKQHFTHSSLLIVYISSVILAAIMAGTSLIGLIVPSATYSSQELAETFVPNDVLNLFIGLPVLLLSVWLAFRGTLLGLLLWPGALFYVVYTYLTYIFSIPFNVLYFGYFMLVVGSVYSIIVLLLKLEATSIYRKLESVVPARTTGIILTVFGSLFAIRALGILIGSTLSGKPLAVTEFGLNITDLIITPFWVVGGVLLIKRKKSGYLVGLGILYQATMLMIGLLAYLGLSSIMTDRSFNLTDFIVVLALSLIFIIPFVLFIRGTNAAQNQTNEKTIYN